MALLSISVKAKYKMLVAFSEMLSRKLVLLISFFQISSSWRPGSLRFSSRAMILSETK